ncbi:hypothetical protein OCL06_10345 [Alteromonas sp. ASW11-19]|uniref:Uncharacterized protein n=1 Tax=Alteromonas salexigens TaxID=2982530 RepID=A0ABT2VPH4_9ALTE|nr:hypothetical protein [Alteromonas salexigens]MCU7555000.1 hypothetical protein [Alteromonas salexigens]
MLSAKNIAVIGTGSSAKSFVESFGANKKLCFYNSQGEGEFIGQQVRHLATLQKDHYDIVVVAVYDYAELTEQLDKLTDAPLYWFNAVSHELTQLSDLYGDNNDHFIAKADVLTVVYDFRVAPPTYDLLNFLVRCKLEANQQNAQSLEVIFCPGDKQGFRKDIDFFSVEEMNFRIVNLLLPLVKLVDPNASIFLAHSRREARERFESAPKRFPSKHDFLRPQPRHFFYELFEFMGDKQSHMILNASAFYREKVNQWSSSRGLNFTQTVVITLRESSAHNARNSDLKLWRNIADRLLTSGLDVVIVRDTETALLPLSWEGIYEFPEAALNVHMRLALYEQVRFNVAVSNGSQALMSLSKSCKYLLFGMHNTTCTSNTAEHLKKIGMIYGNSQRLGAVDGQYLCWDEVTEVNVWNAITRLMTEKKL